MRSNQLKLYVMKTKLFTQIFKDGSSKVISGVTIQDALINSGISPDSPDLDFWCNGTFE